VTYLKRPSGHEPGIRELIERIRLNFPVPSQKPDFRLVYPASLSESERRLLQEIYERLPDISPKDFENTADPFDFDPEIFIGYASCFLISKDGSTLGLDPYECGLYSGISESSTRGCGYMLFRMFRGSIAVGDRLDQQAKQSLLALCTDDQYCCLLDYLIVFNEANDGLLSECIEIFTTLGTEDTASSSLRK